MFLASLLLLASTLHAGPERSITPPLPDASPYNQWVGDVDTDGTVALMVWNEEETLAAARIDRDGTLLDAQPLMLSTRQTTSARVVRGDGSWLVTWLEAPGAIMRRFVRDDGTMSDTVTVLPETAASTLDVAYDGRNFLVAWSEGGLSIRAYWLTRNGVLLESPITLPSEGGVGSVKVAAFHGGGFAAGAIQRVEKPGSVTGYEDTVVLYRLDTNANVVSSGWLDRTSTAFLDNLQLTVDGDTVVAAWSGSGMPEENLFVAREGEPLRLIATGPVPCAIVNGGGAIFVVAVNPFDKTAYVFSEDGTRRRVLAGRSGSATAASFGDRLVVTTTTSAGFETDIAATIVDTALEDVAPRRRLTFVPALQERPAVARNAAGEALVAWVESGRADGSAVVTGRVDAQGHAIGEAVTVATVPWAVETRVQVASDGAGYLVAWHEWNDAKGVRARRVSREGVVSSEPVFVPYEYPSGPEFCIAWSGTEYLFGIEYVLGYGKYFHNAQIRVVSVSSSGAIGETRVAIPEVTVLQSVSCASGEAGTLVAAAGTDAQAALIFPNGTVSAPVHLGNTGAPALSGDVSPAVAANGRSFLVAWNKYPGEIEWAVVNDEATVTRPGETLPLEPGDPWPPLRSVAVAPHGDGYLLAWGNRDLRALKLDAEGHSIAGVSLSETPLGEREPALAGGGSNVLAVYTRDIGSPRRPEWRVFTRTLDDIDTPRQRAVRH